MMSISLRMASNGSAGFTADRCDRDTGLDTSASSATAGLPLDFSGSDVFLRLCKHIGTRNFAVLWVVLTFHVEIAHGPYHGY